MTVKRLLLILACVFVLLIPAALGFMQEQPPVSLEITGINPAEFPVFTVTANVYDQVGQPVFGLGAEDFSVIGELASAARILRVENITEDDLSFSTVLAIDTSSSMAGQPLEKAKAAAIAFVNAIGPNDPVAVITFDSNIEQVLDYTTDKNQLINAISSLGFGGQTALYQGALEAVQKAAQSPTVRRALILLSDGAEFGDISRAARADAAQAALVRGVPSYTIGLGFGIDRSYLEELAAATNAEFYESPTSEELQAIYEALAATLRSQYVITLQVEVPGNGATYDLGLQVATDAGVSSAAARLRAPIPAPIVGLPDVPTGPIAQPTTITASVQADDPIVRAEFQIDGAPAGAFTQPPFAITIDPAVLDPGSHQLNLEVEDATGDVAAVSATFEVAALPSQLTIIGLTREPLAVPTDVLVDASGQTPAVSAVFQVDSGTPVTVAAAPFLFSIDPFELSPGDHTLTVAVLNAGGATASTTQPFRVAGLPPRLTVSGVDAGQVISQPVEVNVQAVGQSVLTRLAAAIGSEELGWTTGDGSRQSSLAIVLDPARFAPGAAQLVVTAEDASGSRETITVNFQVAALPPVITLSGLTAGETLFVDRQVTVEVGGQTPAAGVIFRLDGAQTARQSRPPFSFNVEVLAIAPGPHILSVEATNAGGQTATADVAFIIAETPSQTATAASLPTATPTDRPTPTNTPRPTLTATSIPTLPPVTVEAALLTDAQATGTAEFLAALAVGATSTAVVEAANAQSTQVAQATSEAANDRATTEAQAAADARVTGTAAAEQATGAPATEALASVTPDLRATANAQATLDQRATLTVQAAADQNARATLNVQATLDVQAMQTAQAEEVNRQATLAAQATLNAATQTAQAEEANRQATLAAQATLNAATQTAQAEEANRRATLAAQATAAAQSTLNARATLNAQATLDVQTTLNAQALLSVNATRDAQATLDAQAAAATGAANARATVSARATANAAATQTAQAAERQAAATQTAEAIRQATLDAQATLNAQAQANLAATRTAEQVATEEATPEPTAEPTQAQPEATAEATSVAVAATATATGTREAATVAPTLTPMGTLVAETVPGEAATTDVLPILIVIIGLLFLLILLFLFLRRRRNATR